jgi:hypothetical protein
VDGYDLKNLLAKEEVDEEGEEGEEETMYQRLAKRHRRA